MYTSFNISDDASSGNDGCIAISKKISARHFKSSSKSVINTSEQVVRSARQLSSCTRFCKQNIVTSSVSISNIDLKNNRL